MVKVILNGANGAMGKVVADLISADPDMEVVVGVDSRADMDAAFPIMDSINKVNVAADVVIDFSSVEAADTLLDFIEQKKIPAVICTTGLSEAQIDRINELSSVSPILRSANMSLGINILSKVLAEVAPTLKKAGFDIEIVEAHHRRKKDAPSGTALMLEKAVEESIGQALEKVFQREGQNRPREKDEIGMSSVRGGTIPGVHEVLFAGEDEVIKLEHTAYSRKIFAKGALSAAFFLLKQKPGRYTMGDVLRK